MVSSVPRTRATHDGASTAASQVADVIGEISTASGRQAKGIEELTQIVARMDASTQQNASFAEQSAASAASLTDENAHPQ